MPPENFKIICFYVIVEELVFQQKSKKSPEKPKLEKPHLNFFQKKNSCPSLLTNTLKKTATNLKSQPKPNKTSVKNPEKLQKQKSAKKIKNFINRSSSIPNQEPLHPKPNRTFDFPSKDEEIIYNIINQEYKTMFKFSSKKNNKTKKTILPNIDEYLETVKDYRKVKVTKKEQVIKSQYNDISKKIEQNLTLLKLNFEQKRNVEKNEKIEQACKKIQISWRKYQRKQKITFKNVMNICHTTLYQKNRAKILQKRDSNSLNFKKKQPEKRMKQWKLQKEDFNKKKTFFGKKLKIDANKLLIFSNNFPSKNRNGAIDSFSSSKLKHSINTTLNFKEINENSKSLITIHDFNSKSIDREDISKLTSSIHENNLNKNHQKSDDLNKDSSQEPSKNTRKHEKIIKEENSESISEKEDLAKIKQSLASIDINKRNISENIVNLIELSSTYQQELDFIKEQYLSKLNNQDVNNAADKFFSLMKKQCDLNKKILLENFKLNKAIAEKNLDSPFNLPVTNSESNQNDLKFSLKSNLSDLRAAFGSEKLLQEASHSIGREKEKENQRIFEEDSFRNFTNKKIMEFLRKDHSLKNILKIRENDDVFIKKKPKSLDLPNKREKKGLEVEKWVSNEKSKQKKQNKRKIFLEIDLPKV